MEIHSQAWVSGKELKEIGMLCWASYFYRARLRAIEIAGTEVVLNPVGDRGTRYSREGVQFLIKEA